MNNQHSESGLLPKTQKPIELQPLSKNGSSKSHDKLSVDRPSGQLTGASEDDVIIGRFRKISSAKSMAVTNGNIRYPGELPPTENGDDSEVGLMFKPLGDQVDDRDRFVIDEGAKMLPPSPDLQHQNRTKITKSSFRDVEKPSRFRGTSSATRFQTARDDDIGMTTSDDDDAGSPAGEDSDDPLTTANTDTRYGKSFRHLTREALPRLDNYRNIMSLHAAARPTLDELHNASLGPKPARGSSGGGDDSTDAADAIGAVKFGWVQGVLVRCLLNIWGVMLFLRLSWVVAQAGMWQAIVLILTTSVVTTITALSMSAISTNGVIKGGGTYYMISRSLGPEFGGSIGLIFSMANAVACAMYVVGFCESLMDLLRSFGTYILDGGVQDVRIIGSITIVVLTVIVVVGMEWEAKAQLALLFILLVAIFDFIIGSIIGPKSDLEIAKGFIGFNSTIVQQNLNPDYRLKDGVQHNFFSVFSIFFPAATGILAGANISGDLRDPQSSIPKGTLLAILVTTASYIVMAIISGCTVARDATGDIADLINGTFLNCSTEHCSYGLHNSFQVIELVSGFGPLIYAGCFAATLSSALASLVSAPKVFQALCKDKLYPGIEWFGRGYGKNNEPVRGYILTFFISVAFILIGELDTIAPLISNFFLAAYTLINFSTFHGSLVKPVGWRPTFRYYNMWLSLFGAVLCVAVMFLISWWTALLTFSVVLALYLIVLHRKPDVNWGSTTQAQIYNNALAGVLQLNTVTEHVKNYRPQMLVLTGNPSKRPALVHFTNLISKGHSLMVCGHVIQGTINNKTRNALTSISREWLLKHKIKAFYSIVDSDTGSFGKGADALIQASGLGKLKPNILLLGFKNDWNTCAANELAEYVDVMHKALDVHMALVILRLEDGIEVVPRDARASILESHLTGIGDLLESSLKNNTSKGSQYHESSESLANATPAAHISQASSVSDMSASANNLSSNATGVLSVSPDPAAVGKPDEISPPVKKTYNWTGPRKRGSSSSTREPLTIFQRKHTGYIDVWWLYDDGGLTLLLPYLVSVRRLWSSCRLRVFTLANKRTELEFEQRNMASLLSKFRIDYSDLKVIADVTKPPSEETQSYFSQMLNNLGVSPADELAGRERSLRHLRLRELIREHSWGAELLVMTLPMPRRAQVTPPALYMSWLEALTGGPGAPPCLLVRGNHTSVLTFYS